MKRSKELWNAVKWAINPVDDPPDYATTGIVVVLICIKLIAVGAILLGVFLFTKLF